MDRVFSRPAEKLERSLQRIRRKKKIYCAVFSADEPLHLVELYEVEVADAVLVAERQLGASTNEISYLAFSRKWAANHGTRLV